MADSEAEDLNQILDSGITEEWLLVRTGYPVGFILSCYLLFVLKIGPQFMSNRQPYKCTNILRAYNVFQVFYNLWLLFETIVQHNSLYYAIRFTCSTQGHETVEKPKYLFVLYTWHYLVLKILDLMDTIFMVIRKKNTHKSFLHVYHHTTMVVLTWSILKYLKSHHGVVPGTLNLIVHAVMYSYYLLATFPQLKKYLWWKMYLTKLQMSQFVLILAYFLYIYWKGCPMSKMFNYGVGFVAFTFLCLFANFYIKTYIQTPTRAEEKQDEQKQL